jgi:beta-glucosidase-like glycosyl hydrolase
MLGGAFADGLAVGGMLATAKHFPGLGRATTNEDLRLNRIEVDRDLLRAADEAPFAVTSGALARAAIEAGADRVLALRERLR